MARGMAAGEGIVSQAQSKVWDEGYDRTNLGKRKTSGERGRFVWDSKRGKLVRPWEIDRDETQEARFAPVMPGRIYENVNVPGTDIDIGSRQRRKDYMRRNDLADADDFKGDVARANARRREILETGRMPADKQRKESLARELERIVLMPQARYEKELKQRERERRERGERGL